MIVREGQPPGREGQFLPRPPERLQPYLGVITRPAPAEIHAQLPKAEGFGLLVDDLLPESPAQTAGLQRNDLVVRFDDQWLVTPPQLEALVRRAGKDKEVALTVFRAGEEKKVTVKIGEKMLPERRSVPGMERWPGPFEREFGPRGDDGGPRPRGGEREFGQGAGGERDIRYAPQRARRFRQDASGSYELSPVDGVPTFVVKTPDGTVSWQGPVKTPEQRQAVPAQWQMKLGQLETVRIDLTSGRRADGQPRPGPGKFPRAIPVEGREGYVRNPNDERQRPIDVRGLPPGSLVEDPYTPGETLVLPPRDQAAPAPQKGSPQ
jgi:hypothetical protein